MTHSVPLPGNRDGRRPPPCETQLCSQVLWLGVALVTTTSGTNRNSKSSVSEGVPTPVWAERRSPTHLATNLFPLSPGTSDAPRGPTRERAQRVAVVGSHGRLHPSRQPEPGPGPTFQVSQVPSASAPVPSGPRVSSRRKRSQPGKSRQEAAASSH